MHYLADLEEQIESYRRQANSHLDLERAELAALLEELDQESGGIKRRFATFLAQLGCKLDREAVEELVASHEAA